MELDDVNGECLSYVAQSTATWIRQQNGSVDGWLDWLNDRWLFIPLAELPAVYVSVKHLQMGNTMIYMHLLRLSPVVIGTNGQTYFLYNTRDKLTFVASFI